MQSDSKIRPNKVLPPGFTVRKEIAALGLTQKAFAALIERPPQFVSELLKGKRELTIDSANRIAAALGSEPGFWLRLESNYRLWLNQQAEPNRETYERIRQKTLQHVAEKGKEYS